jgi:hypothetical protein
VDGSFITKLCPKRMCVYLMSQLVIPVALINERFSEDLDPNDFHFMRYARCPDVVLSVMDTARLCLKYKLFLDQNEICNWCNNG